MYAREMAAWKKRYIGSLEALTPVKRAKSYSFQEAEQMQGCQCSIIFIFMTVKEMVEQ